MFPDSSLHPDYPFELRTDLEGDTVVLRIRVPSDQVRLIAATLQLMSALGEQLQRHYEGVERHHASVQRATEMQAWRFAVRRAYEKLRPSRKHREALVALYEDPRFSILRERHSWTQRDFNVCVRDTTLPAFESVPPTESRCDSGDVAPRDRALFEVVRESVADGDSSRRRVAGDNLSGA